ncbi:MAG: HAD hydrolase family protein [Phycisphaerales bacterium]|nr:HAD hydrolase family protein [Phycisphaerales bacterium]
MPGPIRAIIADNDGCLSSERGRVLDVETLTRLGRWNRRSIDAGGPVLTICSGRPVPFVEAMSRLLQNDALPCIGENGAWIYDVKRNTHELDPSITPHHLDAVRSMTAWVERDLMARGVVIQPGKTASISLHHEETTLLMDLIPTIRTRVEREGWPIRVSATWFYINCDLEHVSKATAIDRFCAMTGIAHDELAGIGDTMSDMAIRSRVAWFGCPSNAQEDLKPHADHIASKAEAEGVEELVEVVAGIGGGN